MAWFGKKKKKDITFPEKMSPLEAVTHLFAAGQLSDQQTGYEERESWLKAISELFPDYSDERAENYINDAYKVLNQKHGPDRKLYIIAVLSRIKELLDEGQIAELGPKIIHLIEADGIVMSAEMEIAKLIAAHLGITINIEDED